jgi:hypothetical protein
LPCRAQRGRIRCGETILGDEAFFLIRSFSKLGKDDFPVALLSLADRLSITPAGASCVISKLVGLGAIEQTAQTKINSKSARYRWIANVEKSCNSIG